MDFRAYIEEALRQLLSSKMRAFLAVLGILVGTASVVAMVSIGKLAQEQILAEFKHMGISLLSVSIYPEGHRDNPDPNANLSLKNAQNLANASEHITIVAPYVNSYGSVIYKGKSLSGSTVGITPDMSKIAKLDLNSGRMLSFLDKDNNFCVIGHELLEKIQKETGIQNPLGSQIRVGDTIFTIVGTLKKWPMNFFFNTDFNSAILIPIGTALSIKKDAKINNLAIRLGEDTDVHDDTQEIIKKYIDKNTIKQRVSIRSPKSIIDSYQKSSGTMTLLLGMIGSISLIVGGIGVMNIMLVSVAERKKEIGIRLAVGAKQKDIQMQFLIESIVLAIFGGVFGMIIGLVITYFVALFSSWEYVFFAMPPILGCGVSILVGIFFGFYPALKASKLDPIQTLRGE